jgi:two-component system, cell cycle response regulator DivK
MHAKRILYVEDNFQNKRLVKKILAAKGYEVLEAEDGLTGVEMANAHIPDLILMDINIPGIDGMEATARIKNSPQTGMIPVIALTANAMRGDREKIIAAGCDEYLQKPINNAKLVETVQLFIGAADVPEKPTLPKPPKHLTQQLKTIIEDESLPSALPNKVSN